MSNGLGDIPILYGENERTNYRKKFSRTDEKEIYNKYKDRCAICKRQTEFYDGEIDHIKSRAKGGSNRPENLQWLCHRCNKLKGHKRSNEQVMKILGLKTRSKKLVKKPLKKRRRPSYYDPLRITIPKIRI